MRSAMTGNSRVLRIKSSNVQSVLRACREKRALSRQELVRETGLSLPTIARIVKQLIAEGVIAEGEVASSTGGRKPVLLRFLPESRYAFGVDFASNHLTYSEVIRVALIDFDGRIVRTDGFSYQDFDSVDAIMAHISAIAAGMLEENGISAQSVLGIGISLPGPVDELRKVLAFAPNVPPKLGMRNLDFSAYRELFPFPVFIENEANAAALAELQQGSAKNRRNVLYLSVNRGISAGILFRGLVYKGNGKKAGQVGHMTIAGEGLRCTCGMLDCWEIYAATGALIRNYNARARVSRVADTKAFLGKLSSGDSDAREVWDRYIRFLAVGISNLLQFYDPDQVVVGGEISQFGDLLLDPLRRAVFDLNTFHTPEETELTLSTLKEDSCLLGAALLPLRPILFVHRKIL
jgi:predicted NBD/HSP70 family sugar kinase